MNSLQLFFLAFTSITLLVSITWLFAVKWNNFSIIDSVWSFSFLIHAVLFSLFSDGFYLRKILLVIMICIWSFRLGFYLTKRIAGHHPTEDSRYVALRAEYGKNFKKRFYSFFLMQAFSVSLLTWPFMFSFKNQNTSIQSLEIFGFILWIISILGETLADHQMNSFKSHPHNKGEVCNIGLWKYSRHPNYFFESMIWWSFYIFLLGTPHLWWGAYCPLIILFLLLKVTGVPPSEEQSLKNRGEKYRAYQKQTSVFIPWFKKS